MCKQKLTKLRWLCHVDDDNYLNVKRLYEVLNKFDPMKPWYLGKKSISTQISANYNNVIFKLK